MTTASVQPILDNNHSLLFFASFEKNESSGVCVLNVEGRDKLAQALGVSSMKRGEYAQKVAYISFIEGSSHTPIHLMDCFHQRC